MKKIILLSLLLAVFACKKQEITSFATPDCVQTQINTAIIVDCAVCLISVVQYEYKNQDYYLMSHSTDLANVKNSYLIDNQCDTICVKTHLDCDLNCGKFENFFVEAKKIKTVFGD